MRIGSCLVPHPPVDFREPPPPVEGYRALKAAGCPELRLQYNINDPSAFESYFRPAHNAGMRIVLNAVYGPDPSGKDMRIDDADPARVAALVSGMMHTYAGESSVICVSPHNEPGMEPSMLRDGYDISRGGTLDWIEDVYFPRFVEPFFQAVRNFREDYPVAAFDSDSDGVHKRCMDATFKRGLLVAGDGLHHFTQTGHLYGDVGGGDYATTARFADAFDMYSSIPHLCSEIDPQQLPSVRAWKEAHPGEPWIATDDEIRAMIGFMRDLRRNDPDCQGIYFGDLHSWLFTRTQHADMVDVDQFDENGKLVHAGTGKVIVKAINYPTFFTSAPELSPIGKEFVAAIEEINGPVDSVVTTMPVPGRRPGQGRR